MRITMIGHSTILMEVGGLRVLTDPYFGTWGNPAYKRLAPPSAAREELTDVDLVLISHNHFDHTDRRFLRSLDGSVPVLAPARVRWLTKLKGARNLRGMRTWETKTVKQLRITAVPAVHMAVTLGSRSTSRGTPFVAPFWPRSGNGSDSTWRSCPSRLSESP